jgi:hypothetical protein
MLTKTVVLILAVIGTALGQETPLLVTPTPHVFALAQDKVLPQVVAGGGWETVVVLLNMSAVSLDFQLNFYDETGKPMLPLPQSGQSWRSRLHPLRTVILRNTADRSFV